ncbi:MAG: hypothetical protein R2762_00575 [Bryobacteraceae bacterium]
MRHRSFFAAATLLAAFAGALFGAPPLTTIRDTIYKADGSRFTGSVIIEWRSFEASDTSFIGRQRLQTDVVDGLLNIRLVPTTSAASTAWYQVRYVSNGSLQFYEAWAVSPSATPLRVRDVRVADPLLGPLQSPLTSVEISDVNGLESELSVRPRQGLIFLPSRAAIINADGEIESAAGAPEDCIRVDGSSGPCGSGSGGGSAVTGTFVDGETPSGVVDGANRGFGLVAAPSPAASLLLYRNGILQKASLDYTLSSNNVQFVIAATPQPGDILVASYRTAGTGGTLPRVLCTGVGSETTVAAMTSLGTCAIPAGALTAGSRLEAAFELSHGGTAAGFGFEVRWGGTTVMSRTATSGTAAVSGRAGFAVNNGAASWSTQSWGAGLAMEAGAGQAADALTGGVLLDFRGSPSGGDAVNLRGFTVTVYPAP